MKYRIKQINNLYYPQYKYKYLPFYFNFYCPLSYQKICHEDIKKVSDFTIENDHTLFSLVFNYLFKAKYKIKKVDGFFYPQHLYIIFPIWRYIKNESGEKYKFHTEERAELFLCQSFLDV